MHVKTRTERRRDFPQGHADKRILFKEIEKEAGTPPFVMTVCFEHDKRGCSISGTRGLSESDPFLRHFVDDRQTKYIISPCAESITSALEALLNRDPDSGNRCSSLSAQIQQPVHCISHCKEIVYDQDIIIFCQETL